MFARHRFEFDDAKNVRACIGTPKLFVKSFVFAEKIEEEPEAPAPEEGGDGDAEKPKEVCFIVWSCLESFPRLKR